MKTIGYLIAIFYCITIAFALCGNGVSGNSTILMIQSDREHWLTIENFDKQFPKHGFEPNSTKIFSTYKPMFRQNYDKQWEIIFVK